MFFPHLVPVARFRDWHRYMFSHGLNRCFTALSTSYSFPHTRYRLTGLIAFIVDASIDRRRAPDLGRELNGGNRGQTIAFHKICKVVARYCLLTCVLAFGSCLAALVVLASVVSCKSASDSRSSARNVHMNVSNVFILWQKPTGQFTIFYQKTLEIFDWSINGKTNLVRPVVRFPEGTFLQGGPKFAKGISKRKI